MSLLVNVEIIGGRELLKALKELGAAASQRGGPVKSALRKASLPILDSAQMSAAKHTDTGDLLASLKILRHPNPINLNEIYGVGVHSMGKRPERGKDQRTGKPWYAALVEYGGRGKSGPLKGFLRAAMESNRAKSNAIFRRELGAGIEKIAKKVGNENARKVGAKVARGTISGGAFTRTTPSGLTIRSNIRI